MEAKGTAETSAGALLVRRWERLRTAAACGTPDRVPISLYMDAFTARTAGLTLADFARDAEVAGAAMVATLELLGDIDSTQAAVFLPAALGMLWLSPVMLPGRELPENTLWQLDEQVRILPKDYDRIARDGWDAWFGEYVERHLGTRWLQPRSWKRPTPGGRQNARSADMPFSPRVASTIPTSTSVAAARSRSSPSTSSRCRAGFRRRWTP